MKRTAKKHSRARVEKSIADEKPRGDDFREQARRRLDEELKELGVVPGKYGFAIKIPDEGYNVQVELNRAGKRGPKGDPETERVIRAEIRRRYGNRTAAVELSQRKLSEQFWMDEDLTREQRYSRYRTRVKDNEKEIVSCLSKLTNH